jgi:hypothetical protein
MALLMAAFVLTASLGLTPATVSAAETDDLFAFDSAQDWIGQDEEVEFTDADGSIILQGGQTSPDSVVVQAWLGDMDWQLRLRAPAGQALEVGTYPMADRSGDLVHPGLDFTGNGNACNSASGSFQIHSLTRDQNGDATSIAVSFTFRCDDSFGYVVGRARVNSSTPIASLSLPDEGRLFGPIVAGHVLAPRTYEIEADGDLSVTVGLLGMAGADAARFPLSDDTCSGASLDPGDTCTYRVGFSPITPCGCEAALIIPSDLVLPIGLPYVGWGLIPTTTTVVPEVHFGGLEPLVHLRLDISPKPDGGLMACTVDGEPTPGPLGGLCLFERTVGAHTAVGMFLGAGDLGPSESAPTTFEVRDETATTVHASNSSIGYGGSTTLTARVSTADDLLFPGGTLTLTDETTGDIVTSAPIDARANVVEAAIRPDEGTHRFVARYDGGVGPHLDSSASTTVSVSPALKPRVALRTGVTFEPSAMRLKVRWTPKDPGTVSRFEVQRRSGSGSWVTVSLSTPRATSVNVTVASGKTYAFRVRARHTNGQLGAWAESDAIRPFHYQESTPRATWSSGWKAYRSSNASGGSTRYSGTKGRSVSFSFTGRAVALVSPLSSSRGSAKIYVDGTYIETVSLNQVRSEGRQVVFSRSWTASGAHTLKVVVAGTSRPRVDVDAFEIVR